MVMQRHSGQEPPHDKFNAFWERMALHYPLPFDEKTLADTLRVLALVKDEGVELMHRSVLDIGCGCA